MTSLRQLWWISLLVKLILAAGLPLAADEAYYWIWSHHLQWSYFDHPSMIAFLLWLGHPLENLGSAIRWPAVLLSHASLGLWLLLLKDRLSEEGRWTWMWLMLAAPLTGLGSLIATPDLPLLFFWPLGLLCYERALQSKSVKWYAALGLSLGLGFCSKYHIVLLVPILLLDLTFEKRWRRVNWTAIPVTIVTGLIASLPVVLWNASHDWESFRFQLEHGLNHGPWRPEWTWSYLGGQILLLGPWLIPAFIRGARDSKLRLFFWNAIFLWAFFTYSSFKSVVEANWPIAAFPAAFVLVACALSSKKVRFFNQAFWWGLSALVISQWAFNWIPGINPDTNESQEYRDLSHFVSKYQPLYANTYQMASIITFETKTDVPKLAGMSRFDFFDQLPESKPAPGPFFLLKREGQELPKWLREGHNRLEVLDHQAPDFEVVRITPE